METVLNATNGAKWTDLSPQDQQTLAALARYTGLPINFIARSMDSASNDLSQKNYQTQLDNYYNQVSAYNQAQTQQSNAYKYFEDAVNLVNSGKTATEALEPVAQGVIQVLSAYGIRVQ